MSNLFQPYQMGPLFLRNRFIRSATSDNLADDRGLPTREMIRLYSDLAGGEIGMINTGVIKPRPSWFAPYRTLMLNNASGAKLLREFTEMIHEKGAKITAQMTPYFTNNARYLAPTSPLPGLEDKDQQPAEASVEDIQRVIRIYGELAGLIREAGFDAIQLHAAHGYGLHQFISSFFNRRSDEYGGSLQNRFRIISEVRQAVRDEAGDDFPVWIKLTTGDFVEGGMDIEDSIAIALLLKDNDFFAVEPSCGSIVGNWKSRGPLDKKEWREGYLMDRTERIKARINIPVVILGGLRRLDSIESYVAQGKSDLVSMSRPFIREPHLLKRWKNGDLSPSQCISCNTCFDLFWSGKPIRCAHNAAYWDKLYDSNKFQN